MSKENTLHFVITGGTIDSYFDPISGQALPNRESYIPEFINLLKLYEECDFTTVCMKDSRDLEESDRQALIL